MSAPATEAVPIDMRGRIDAIGSGRECVVLFGRVSLHDASAALLTGVLPVSVRVQASSFAEDIGWLIERLRREQADARPGSGVASEKLAELLFVQILRAHTATSTALPPGWLRATTDERLVRALRLVHGDPARSWNVSDLAKAAGMSRTRFAVHFKSVAGLAPLAYVAEWRMRLAQRSLREEDASVAELASALGYASESAFSSAFKRIVGIAPASYRAMARREQAR